MKVAIIGTRGIPNRYGGFEQFAEILSSALFNSGIDVYVYCPHDHYKSVPNWNGVKLIHKFCPGFLGSSFSQMIYDLLCILDSRKRNFDIIYHMGYTSSGLWLGLHSNHSVIITNMDGMEWMRKKYNRFARWFLMYSEKLAVKRSQLLIADSQQIKKYLDEKYNVKCIYIPYPATCADENSSNLITPPPSYISNHYLLVIARIQPENNLEMIIDGYLLSDEKDPLVIIGNTDGSYGRFLMKKYAGSGIVFYGELFDATLLNSFRFHSKIYLHGHSAGGTNPSLLEAMAAKALIFAHDNRFNREVLGEDAFYFKNTNDIATMLNSDYAKSLFLTYLENNCTKIEQNFSISRILGKYLQLFDSVLNSNQSQSNNPV